MQRPPTAQPAPHTWSRPLLWLTLSFMTGITAHRFCPWNVPAAWGVATLSLLAACLFAGMVRRLSVFRCPVFPCLAFFSLGFLASILATPTFSPPSLGPFLNRPQTLFLARISSPPDVLPDRLQITLQLQEALCEGKRLPVSAGVLVTLARTRAAQPSWHHGDRVLVRLTLKRFHNFENPGAYDYVRSQAERGLHARAHLADDRFLIRVTPHTPSLSYSLPELLETRIDRFRQKALTWFHQHLDPDPAAFYAALLLGYRVPKSWSEHLNRVGVSHLLSISGLHMGLVSLCTFWLVRRITRFLGPPSLLSRTSDQHLAVWIALLAAMAYALISGLALPTWRSVIMLSFFFGAAFWYRSCDSISALAASALLILWVSPNSLWQISFQLSFAAMFGLFVLYPRFHRFQDSLWEQILPRNHRLRSILHPFVDAFWVSLAANLMVLPLLITHFNGLSVASLLANTLLVPLVGFLVLQPGLLSLALFPLNEHLALPILKTGAWFLHWCQEAILVFSGLSWAFFYVGGIPLSWMVGFYVGLAIILGPWQWTRKTAGLGILVLLVVPATATTNLPPWKPFTGSKGPTLSNLQATVVDVGQGTSVLVQFPTGETLLVDGGGFFDDSFDVGRGVLAPFLWNQGLRKLDFVVLSHDHPDHRNGLRFILSHFDVGEFWHNGLNDGTLDVHTSLKAVASRRNIPVRQLPDLLGEHAVGTCRIHVLHPTPDYLKNHWDGRNLNNTSLVLRIDHGETHLYLPGDIDQSVEHHLFAGGSSFQSSQTMLLSPHHGSEHSNSLLLLERLEPQAVIFTCGYDNWFGFPSTGVLERCGKQNIPVFRTDFHGAIGLVSNGHTWKITPRIPGLNR